MGGSIANDTDGGRGSDVIIIIDRRLASCRALGRATNLERGEIDFGARSLGEVGECGSKVGIVDSICFVLWRGCGESVVFLCGVT